MRTITSIKEMRTLANEWRKTDKRIVFVPTMGYLHEGHISLIRHARQLGDAVVVSIFVNPLQFGPGEDFKQYPRDLDRDKLLTDEAGADILFVPQDDEMYPENYQTTVIVEKLTKGLCGASRPTHFQGVTTVVAKLFNIVDPHVVVLGAKDYQQLIVIKRMIDDLNYKIQVEIGPIIREPSGLAVSSRNKYLSPTEKAEATILHQALRLAETMLKSGECDANRIIKAMQEMINAVESSEIDYIEIIHPETLEPVRHIEHKVVAAISVYIGKTRLIDNLTITI